MNILELQAAIGAAQDGQWGPASKAALLHAFQNRQAPALDAGDIEAAAKRLGCSAAQVRAVRAVEAAGSGFDRDGRPKILYERHKFHRFTGGRYSPAMFSQSGPGGYSIDADGNSVNDSWDKLSMAIATGQVDAAFMACSWGAFQVMGQWWDELDYTRPFQMALSCVSGEAGQLEIMLRFVEHFALQDEIRKLSSNPESCRAFAAAYNGPSYAQQGYHGKLARAMAA